MDQPSIYPINLLNQPTFINQQPNYTEPQPHYTNQQTYNMSVQVTFPEDFEEEPCSYISAQKTFLMDRVEVIDAKVLKTVLERMWGPEGRGYFIGFSKKEKTYFILAHPDFEINIVRAAYPTPFFLTTI